MIKNIISYLFNIIILILAQIGIFFCPISTINNLFKIIISFSIIVVYLLTYIFKWFKFNRLFKVTYIIFMLSCILSIIYSLLFKLGIIETFSSVHALKDYIPSTKEKGVIVYILIQCSQVIFMPIPAAIICVVGTMIYGPLLCGIYCSIGILLGSFISFIIGKTFGYKIVAWIVGKENTDKYSTLIRKRGSFFLIIAFLLPMFPDDILCLIAGITKMKFKTFFWITLITRPIGVICMSFFSSGSLIPFSGWGIYAWIFILIIAIITTILIYKYQDRMQKYLIKKLLKKSNLND